MDNKMILSILKMRKNMHELYKKHNRLATMLAKGIGALCLFLSLNMLYQNNEAMMLLLAVGMALVCSVIPGRYIYAASALITTLHLWNVSWDIALGYVVVVFISWVLVCRIEPNAGIIIAYAPLLFFIKVPFLLALLTGMLASLFGVAALGFGVVFYFLGGYCSNVNALLASVAESESVFAIQAVLASFGNDKEFVLILGAMLIAALVAYILCHQSFDYAWYIGSVAGGIAGLVVYLAGGISFDIEQTRMVLVLTVPIAMIAACLIQFMRCLIDYSGVEYVEFEDDDYYYYVKAVPKVNVIVEDFAIIEELNKKKEEIKEELKEEIDEFKGEISELKEEIKEKFGDFEDEIEEEQKEENPEAEQE